MSQLNPSNVYIYETISLRKERAVSDPSCPAAGQYTSIYTTKSRSTYSVLCGVDFYDANIAHQTTGSMRECLELCSGTAGCIGVTFVPDSYSYCWLKNQVSKDRWNPDSRPGIASAYLSSYSIQAGSSALSTCPGKDGTVYTANSGAQYYIKCNNDIYGYDIGGRYTQASSFNNCLEKCSTTSGCTAVGFYTKLGISSPGVYTCFLKTSGWGSRDIHYASGTPDSTVATGVLLSYAVL